MHDQRLKTWGPLMLIILCASRARAQDSVDAPKPAMAGDNIASVQSGAPADIPDTRPLAGVQNLSLGSQGNNHSFLLPSFGVASAIQINPGNSSPSNSSLGSTTYVSGHLALNKISTRSELLLDYLAAGGLSSYYNEGNSVIQSLDFAETIRGGRWSQTFGEQFTYLPSSLFDFGGLGGLGNFGVGLGSIGVSPGFRQDLIPNQSILTNGAARISNTALTQTSYALGYRSSLTFFGTYGTLHFLDGGLQDSSAISAAAGYNYLLSPLNSMSLSYGFTRLMFSGLHVGADSHTVILSFARRITGRLTFQVGAGPDVQLYKAPVAGSGTVLTWALNSAMTYQLRSWGTSFNYSHSLTGGSGVLRGSEADIFSGHASRNLGNWQLSASAGYSVNGALQQTSINSLTPKGWFAGAQMSRRFVSVGSLFIGYNVNGQSTLGAVCSALACHLSGMTQTVSLGYNWGFRPIILE